MTQRNDEVFQLGAVELAMRPLCTFLQLKIVSTGHCDSSQASHVTQSCLVPSCRLSSSASVQWRECLQ